MASGKISPDVPVRSVKNEIEEIKRQQILAEAVRQFFHNGYEATTVESIADSLGVTKPYIYSRFPSKADLLFAICLLGAAPASETVEFSKTLKGDAPTKLAQVISFFVTRQIERRMEVTLFFREEKSLPGERSDEIDAFKMDFHRMLCALLDEGKQAGSFSIDNISVTASALGGMASWTFTWFRDEGRWAAPGIAREIALLALRTVGMIDAEKYTN